MGRFLVAFLALESENTSMTLVIDNQGRIVLPENLREHLGVTVGDALEATMNEGKLELRPVAVRSGLVQVGRVLVYQPEADASDVDVDAVIRESRETRDTELL